MRLARRNKGYFLLLGLILGVSLSLGHGVLAGREEVEQGLPLDDLRSFSEVFAKIKSHYVEPVEDKVLLEHAIRGMLSGLDPHSNYLDPEAYKDLQVGTSGEFGGLGIEVTMEDGFVKVMAPIDDTPAQRVGIKSGDLIIRLGEKTVKGMSLKDAVDVMRGKPGTDINITVIREGEEKPLKFTVTRAIIKVKSVKYSSLDEGFGYVRITQFQAHTGENLEDALKELKKEAEGDLKGLVLDLRNNPGGVLNAAVSVSDAFLEKGLIVYTEGRVRDSQLKFKATPADLLDGAPIVVLVNGGSASASEIVAGALQDHRRAVIMGTQTFGKGSVQTILPLPNSNSAALKLTTARYYTPGGRSIQVEGITPDIELKEVSVSVVEEEDGVEVVKEADLAGHLENGEAKTEGEETKKVEEEVSPEKDYALYEALNLLRGLHILRQQRG